MAYKSYSNTDEIELQRLNSNSDAGSTKSAITNKKSERTVNFSLDIDINGNKMPKVNKNVQFSTQQENEFEFEIKPNLIPNRKR